MLGLVGESGCGKSAILRCVAGLYQDWTGEIALAGAQVGREIDRARSRLVQMVFQDPFGSLHPPRVLLLDEPTSALNVSVQAEILNLRSDLRQKEGLTSLMVTHDLGVVVHLRDRVAVRLQGEIVETRGASDLATAGLAHPYSKRLVDSSRRMSHV
ncbi:Vitamin B12 import ATP-binding protein BtuD [Paraburkholderia ultramafica]|uniref:Vitamin B12 import ATP-binding protein BtuD n=1 Tax=Paraburkholderia ultramafica TaxID=1544867 RepID=A0A6S7B9J2_9BURK|nr:ATP-binding cassette domain-containing protein [Paraburkholderia ultramafica]CAB3792762.1 Vitamin B12 import ATP-binding protein BtuD [Paraburkholderia ultramafica]